MNPNVLLILSNNKRNFKVCLHLYAIRAITIENEPLNISTVKVHTVCANVLVSGVCHDPVTF